MRQDPTNPSDLIEGSDALQKLQRWADRLTHDLITENARLRESVRRSSNRFDVLRSIAREAMGRPPDLCVPPLPATDRRKRENRTAILHISDTQLGKLTESYNMEVAEARILQAAEKTIRFTEDQRHAYKIEECRLYLTGDLVEGETIFPTQAHVLEASLLRQAVVDGPAIFVKLVLRLLECFRRVKVISVPGNHGRSGRFNDPESNWDSVTSSILKAMLLGSEDYPRRELADRLEVVVSADWKYVDQLPGGWGVLLVHGHQIKGGSYGGYPWYGAGKASQGWALSMDEPFNYVMFGHRHSEAHHIQGHVEWHATGTTETDDEYALETLKTMSFPIQTLYFANAEHGIVQSHTLYLGAKGDRRPIQFRFEGDPA